MVAFRVSRAGILRGANSGKITVRKLDEAQSVVKQNIGEEQKTGQDAGLDSVRMQTEELQTLPEDKQLGRLFFVVFGSAVSNSFCLNLVSFSDV